MVSIAENRFLVPVKALRDEGTSYHYVAPSRYIDIDPKMLRLIEKTLLAQGLAYQEVSPGQQMVFTEKPKKKWLIARKKGVRLLRWNVLP